MWATTGSRGVLELRPRQQEYVAITYVASAWRAGVPVEGMRHRAFRRILDESHPGQRQRQRVAFEPSLVLRRPQGVSDVFVKHERERRHKCTHRENYPEWFPDSDR